MYHQWYIVHVPQVGNLCSKGLECKGHQANDVEAGNYGIRIYIMMWMVKGLGMGRVNAMGERWMGWRRWDAGVKRHLGPGVMPWVSTQYWPLPHQRGGAMSWGTS